MTKIRRATRQRDAILKVLRSTKCHPTADWIYDQTRKVIPNISLGTVYRNLNILREMGEIMELNYGPDLSRYDGNPVNHYHFFCQSCGRVYDLEFPSQKGLDEAAEKSTGFQVLGHRLEFYGLCQECLARDKDKTVLKEPVSPPERAQMELG
ncbi:MAG: transcriptional repressor [Firmicutes bacterium]|nr:transcriptional repressor [Bacillota bacterium]MCL5039053.1 transcriptional repressor [Bacillota bacterium]